MRWLNFLQQIQANQHKVSSGLFVLIIVLIAWFIGAWIWFPATQTTVTKWIAAPINLNTQTNTVDLNKIGSAHLFGIEQKTLREAPAVINTNAPETKLDLKLVGLVFSPSPENSLAIIASKGSQDTYGIDETIDNTRAKLKAVLTDKVVIDNSGRDETLSLDDKLTVAERENLVTEPRVLRKTNQDSDTEQEGSLDDFRNAITEEPRKLLNYVNFSEFRQNGEVIGYKVNPAKSSLLFETTDLEPGDVVLEINGVRLSDMSGLMSATSELIQASEINLLVERNGQQEEIHIQL